MDTLKNIGSGHINIKLVNVLTQKYQILSEST